MVSTDLLATLGLNAINAILVLSFVALGLAIIFGFMEIINLTHGAFLMLGSYVVWLTSTELGIGFWIGFVLAPIVVGFIGLLTEILVIKHLYHRLLDTLLATWGLAIVIREVIRLVFGRTSKRVSNPLAGQIDLGLTVYPIYRLFMIVFSLSILLSVFALFYRTNFGIRLRAVIQDEDAASLLGLNQHRMYQFSYAFGSGLAGLAGAMVAPVTSVQPDMGLTYLLESFFAVIIGGVGSLVGVIWGATIVAGFTNIMTFTISPVVAQTTVFVLVIVILAIRPSLKRRFEWGETL